MEELSGLIWVVDTDTDDGSEGEASPSVGQNNFLHLPGARGGLRGFYEIIDRRIAGQGREIVDRLRVVAMRFLWIDGVFASFADHILGSFVSVFVLAFGATNSQIGLLTAVANFFGVIALFPGAWLADRSGKRKQIVLWTIAWPSRFGILVLAAIPFVAPRPQAAILAVICLTAVRSFLTNYGYPAWMSLVADLVPEPRRGRYFSERNITMGLAGLLVIAFAGMVVRRLNGAAGLPFAGYQLVFFIAFLAAMASSLSFTRVPEPPSAAGSSGSARRSPLELFRSLRLYPRFTAFLAGGFVWNFSLQFAGPFYNVFLVSQLGGTAESVGYATAATALAGLAGQRVFGALADRRSPFAVMRLCGLLIPIIPMAWAATTQVWQVYLINLFAGFFWAGYNLASFNMLLSLAPTEHRSQATALFQSVVFASSVLGPLAGGMLIDLYSHRLVFAVSGAGRLVAMGLFLFLMSRSGRDGVLVPTAGRPGG